MRWLNKYSRSFLSRGYLVGDTTPEERIMHIGKTAEDLLKKKGLAKKFYNYMSKGYYSLSTPVWSNFGLDRGLPISCFNSYVGDDMGQILFSASEVGMMSKYGGGTSGYFGDIRHRGAKISNNGTSSGSVHFMRLFETVANIVSQGSTRRGHFSPYLPISHPDIDEFLDIGTEGNPIQISTHGVTVDDAWMKEMIDGDKKKRETWAKLLTRRTQMGYPYVMFSDTANKNTVDVYRDKGLRINSSNMCSEILLPSNEKWSFVCDLSSMNLLYYDEWKDTDAVETLVYLLDAVMEEFIIKLEKLRDSKDSRQQEVFHFLSRAHAFAKANRALGLGVLGWHSLVQSKMLSLESKEAAQLNLEVFRKIREQAYSASEKLAKEYGEPEILKGYGRRNTTLMAIAPTTSSAFILGQVSQSIEPIWSNCYVKDVAKLKVTIKNKKLEELLKKKEKNTKEVWKSIRDNDGSVQHLDFLTDREKNIFKTFQEIDQKVILDQAAVRQTYIDQGQSLNLAVNPSISPKDLNALHVYAWQIGIKTLYYQHSVSAAQQFGRLKEQVICESCE